MIGNTRLSTLIGDSGDRTLEVLGFYHGTQGVSPEHTLAEVGALHKRLVERSASRWADAIGQLGARVDTLTREGEAADATRRELEREHATPPPVALPVLAVAGGLLAAAAEIWLLAPVMDGLGIADPAAQVFTVLGFVVVLAVAFSVAAHPFLNRTWWEQTGAWRRVRTVGACTLTALGVGFAVLLGLWRAEEIIFAGAHSIGALGAFLASTPVLTRALMPAITALLPLGVSIALEWGLARLGDAWNWRLARRASRVTARRRDVAAKRLEAAIERRDHERTEIERRCDECGCAYLENHELGRVLGARRLPWWHLIPRAVTAFGVAAGAVLAGMATLGVVAPVTAFAAGVLSASAATARGLIRIDRPSPKEVYRTKAVLFREDGRPLARPRPVETAVPDAPHARTGTDR